MPQNASGRLDDKRLEPGGERALDERIEGGFHGNMPLTKVTDADLGNLNASNVRADTSTLMLSLAPSLANYRSPCSDLIRQWTVASLATATNVLQIVDVAVE